MSKKLQISVYRLNNNEDILKLNSNIKLKGFKQQKTILNETKKEKYTYDVYYYEKEAKNPDFKDFLINVVIKDEDILTEKNNINESFILIFKTLSNYFIVTGGIHAYYAVNEYIDEDFGFKIISNLVEQDQAVLNQVKQKNVMGNILGNTKYFRNSFSLFDNEDFGQFYKEINSKLDTKLINEKFGLDIDEKKNNCNCIVKESFKINKSISFEDVEKILKGIDEILMFENQFKINKVNKISRFDKELKENLDMSLLNQLWERFNSSENSFDFDICHSNYEDYLTANKYILFKGESKEALDEYDSLEDIDDIFKTIKNNDKENNDIIKDEFFKLIKKLRIESINEEDRILTKDSLINHLFGDVIYNNKKYFFVDKNWYFINSEFINSLNQKGKSIVDKIYIKNNILLKKFKANISEGVYNNEYKDLENFIVLDKQIQNNIELCDLLTWDNNNNLFIIHVKQGFNNKMRDLTMQLKISTKVITEIVNSPDKENQLTEIYNKFSGNIKEKITKEDFIFLFNKDIKYLLAITDNTRNIKDDFTKFNSNIAKFQLLDLYNHMKIHDLELRMIQIDYENK